MGEVKNVYYQKYWVVNSLFLGLKDFIFQVNGTNGSFRAMFAPGRRASLPKLQNHPVATAYRTVII
ncbi:hypothetical protein [Adhaeribacter radiodurans]|uniref:Uncharacterized protein n=1 Tax=Adhaeribacter radiodurans TaxID=2745197 RepID=A0A7L7L7R1_9BACT|nr:hypothetical protein [Adhaeribacter radiodurans]QMU28575.1 hypothetical protein HUW48_11225 [Adhaeribacter radiodurans]